MTQELWTVVLAAGAGRRLRQVTGDVPKQYWRRAGAASLLDHTLKRFAPFSPRSRTVVVVDAAHRHHVAAASLSRRALVTVQPEDRGTAAGVMLGLLPVLDRDPAAIVAITPADHGVLDVARFNHGLLAAIHQAQGRADAIVFGVEPTDAHDDYGWITPGPPEQHTAIREVRAFVEKPAPEVAARLLHAGAVWNTMLLVVRARVLRELYADLLPPLSAVFEDALMRPAAEREAFLAAAYPQLPRFDFSHDILTHARNLKTLVWPAAIGWSDLGTPARLRAWHRRVEAAAAAAGRRRVSAA